MAEMKERMDKVSEKEAWNKPEFEVIGVENTQFNGNPGKDSVSTGS